MHLYEHMSVLQPAEESSSTFLYNANDNYTVNFEDSDTKAFPMTTEENDYAEDAFDGLYDLKTFLISLPLSLLALIAVFVLLRACINKTRRDEEREAEEYAQSRRVAPVNTQVEVAGDVNVSSGQPATFNQREVVTNGNEERDAEEYAQSRGVAPVNTQVEVAGDVNVLSGQPATFNQREVVTNGNEEREAEEYAQSRRVAPVNTQVEVASDVNVLSGQPATFNQREATSNGNTFNIEEREAALTNTNLTVFCISHKLMNTLYDHRYLTREDLSTLVSRMIDQFREARDKQRNAMAPIGVHGQGPIPTLNSSATLDIPANAENGNFSSPNLATVTSVDDPENQNADAGTSVVIDIDDIDDID